MSEETVLFVDLEGFTRHRSGKVREVFEVGDHLLIVATDRISAFDVVMPNGIPGKGRVLTALSLFWFDLTADVVPNHFVTADLDRIEAVAGRPLPQRHRLRGRTMLVHRTRPVPMECVVRGYLSGSGWKEYRGAGTVGGHPLPAGLRESDRLPSPLFTPSTKEESGHDRNLDPAEARDLVGGDLYDRLAQASLMVYQRAADFARTRGIIIADTKFEFGFLGDRLILIDEVLTPDSSRFWPQEGYRPGGSQPSFDKQFVRDYLESTPWDKSPPAPALPDDIVARTAAKYHEAQRLITGRED
jgi:phosphoribosylaminoimidazole-succinocarboxamide synthase